MICVLELYIQNICTDRGVNMFYFMCFITFICVFNLLVMAFIVWKFGIDVFFTNDEESAKDIPLNRSQ